MRTLAALEVTAALAWTPTAEGLACILADGVPFDVVDPGVTVGVLRTCGPR